MTREAINELKKYTLGRKNTEKVEISVLQLNRVIKALEQEPCGDAISRKLVKLEYKRRLEDSLKDKVRKIDLSQYADCTHFNKFIDSIPPVNPQEPKTGHWISFGVQGEVDGQIVQTFTCSECGAISIFRLASGNIINGDLCPNCGAKMESEE